MCPSLISCPLCTQPHFSSLEALRIGLIKVATENLVCPMCSDVFIGLDKLTIHLFSHCDNMPVTNKEPEVKKTKSVKVPSTNKSEITTGRRVTKYQKTHQNSNPSVPVFNINTLPFIGIPKSISESICNETTENNNSQIGILSEKCDICGYYFLGQNILQMHKKLIHNFQEDQVTSSNKYPCHLCTKVFKMRGSLMVHLRVVHLGIGSSKATSKDDEENIKIEPQITANEAMDQEKSIENIKKTENKPIHNDTNAPSPNSNNVGIKQWECDICHKSFTTKYFLKKHKRLHTGEMPYSCIQCNKTFTFQQSYHKHLLYHNDDKPHTCTNCGRAFKELSTLHNHQRIHTGEKPFSCESCGKCFRQRVSYLVHRRIHTGVMPYKCTACDKSFRYKVSQRTHKCAAQPPGTVVRQSGELVQKLIKNQSDPSNMNMITNFNGFDPEKLTDEQYKPNEIAQNISNSNDDAVLDSELFAKKCEYDGKNIIDEIINDSIKKIDFCEPRNSIGDNIYSMISNNESDKSIPSPSEKFKKLHLSPDRNEDCFQMQIVNENFRCDFPSTSFGDNAFGKM